MKISHTLKLINFSLYVLHYTLVDREQCICFLVTKHVALESHELFFSNVHYFRLSLIQFACNGVGPPWLVSMTISGGATPMQVKWIKVGLVNAWRFVLHLYLIAGPSFVPIYFLYCHFAIFLYESK